MPLIYIVSDSQNLKNSVSSAIAGPGNELVELSSGIELMELLKEENPDLVIVDLQVANMGATAITLDIRLGEKANRIKPTKVLVMLDRRADVFMTRRSGADGFIIKPLDSLKIKRAVNAILKSGSYEDQAFMPA
ncbi:MAG: response regulator [Acidimicrobiaceae bacterium]|nr:response regulator [Acidimicrobiaceae bacterium]